MRTSFSGLAQVTVLLRYWRLFGWKALWANSTRIYSRERQGLHNLVSKFSTPGGLPRSNETYV